MQKWFLPVLPEDWRNAGFGLYLHWPFCLSKCPYCDFNSHVSTSVDQQIWADAYVNEIARVGALTGPRILNTVFFGGGTPSLMQPEIVDRILEAVRKTWPMANDCEITLEANPTSIEAGRFRGYRAAGVNRISIGIQSLNDNDLRRLGRMHTAREAMAALEIAYGIFDRVSFDLIYARQGQTLDAWQRELKDALAMAADHLSLYQLTIEDGTVFGERHRLGKLDNLPDENLAADMYDLTQETCDKHGFPAYEVSNHAAPGNESRHNLIYWRYGDYAGIGPGAHGRLTLSGKRVATKAKKNPTAWLEAVTKNGTGERPVSVLSRKDVANEFLMMGLRLQEGIELDRYVSLSGDKEINNKINMLCDINLLRCNKGRLQTTRKGRILLNALLRELLTE